MRIARAHSKLNDLDAAEKQYLEIINSRAGSSKYFLFQEFSELLYSQSVMWKAGRIPCYQVLR